jgi:HAD superfamily hydrolase (TIGR01459 family)
MSDIPLLPGLETLAERYETFIVDLWGVMHDGVNVFPAALDCLRRLKAGGARIVILSNAPRRASAVAARNAELGIDPELVDLVMSSGEVAWRHLKDRPDPWYRALGRRCHQLGPARDLGMREDLGLDFVEDPAEADFILLTGAVGMRDRVEDYQGYLSAALDRGLPMVCANPDWEVIRDGAREICAGAIAKAYVRMGGDVRYHGKPDREIYDACLAPLGSVDRGRVLALGDSLRTDVAGAQGAGIDAVFVAGGIHATELGMDGGGDPDRAVLRRLFENASVRPLAVLSVLSW